MDIVDTYKIVYRIPMLCSTHFERFCVVLYCKVFCNFAFIFVPLIVLHAYCAISILMSYHLFRKPLKTTRILAEIDDETSGTDSYYIGDSATGLPDTLMSDDESRNIEYTLTSESPLLTEGVDSGNKTDDVNIPTVAGICIYVCLSFVFGFCTCMVHKPL